MSATKIVTKNDLWLVSVQGTVMSIYQSETAAEDFLAEAITEEMDAAGDDDDFDFCDSLGEYAYVKKVTAGTEIVRTESYWEIAGDSFHGDLPEIV